MFNEKVMVYSKEDKAYGQIVEVSYLKNTITIDCGADDYVTTSIENCKVLKFITVVGGGVDIYDGDILEKSNGELYEIQSGQGDLVNLYKLDESLERDGNYKVLLNGLLDNLSDYKFVDNIYTSKDNQIDVDFNIQVAKHLDGTYFYICNNKVDELIDIITVVFVGSILLKEEDYSRITVSYEEYKLLLEIGDLKIVEPEELMVLAMKSAGMESTSGNEEEDDENDFEDEDDDFENDFPTIGDFDDDGEEEDDEGEDCKYQCGNHCKYGHAKDNCAYFRYEDYSSNL